MSDKVQRKPTPRAKKPRAGARPSGRAVGAVSSRARGAAFPSTRRVSRNPFLPVLQLDFLNVRNVQQEVYKHPQKTVHPFPLF